MNIQEYRQQYPQLNNMSDIELTQQLHQQYAPDMDLNEFANQFGVAIPSGFEAAVTGFNTGVERFTHGVWQPLLESGLLSDKVSEKSKAYAKKREDEYTKVSEAHPYIAGAASLVGNVGATAPLALIPGIGQSNLARMVTQGIAQGAASGFGQYVGDNDSRLLNTAVGAGFGAAIPAGVGLAAKGFNAIKGNFADKAAKEAIDLGTKYNVPVYASDAAASPTLNTTARYLEDVPLLGMRGARETQMRAAQNAAQDVTKNLEQQLLNTDFGGKTGIATLERIAQSNSPRSRAAQNVLEEIQNSGDDWNRIIKTSGNLQLLRRKIIADQKFNKVGQLASRYGDVDNYDSRKLLDNIIRQNTDPEIAPVIKNEKLIKSLQDIRTGLYLPDGSPKGLNYNAMRQFRSDLGDLISDYYTGSNAAVGAKGVGYLQQLKNRVESEMDRFAQSNGEELRNAWKGADKFYRNNIVPAKDIHMAQALTNADADAIYGKFVTSGDKTGKATRFYNALDEKGRAAVRYGMVNDAFEHALDRDLKTFSPAKFGTELRRISGAKGVFFKGDAKAEIDGFQKLMRHVERSNQALSRPETGALNVPLLLTSLVTGSAFVAPTATATGLGATYALKQMLTTNAGRRFLLATSKLAPGSPAMQRAIEQFQSAAIRAGTADTLAPEVPNGQ